MLLFILLKVKPLISSRELELCDPAGISSAPSTALARTAPKQQSRPFGGNFRPCPEHSLVQLKPLMVLRPCPDSVRVCCTRPELLSTHRSDVWCSAGFSSCLTKNTILPGGSEGRQPALINREKTLQLKFPSIEEPD